MNGAVIFRDLLRRTVEDFDGTRPYWRSSPFGSGFPNDPTSGNRHQWEVWSFWKDYREYERDTGRFITEFGFQAPAHPLTMKSVLAPEDRRPQSAAMEHHNKQTDGTERLFRFLAAHVGVTNEFEDFIERAQWVQADALRTAVEHWRRRKFRTAGSLFWQLNDCWPVSSWSVIDSALRPKAAYYAARRFFAPVLLSLTGNGRWTDAWGVNDLLKVIGGVLTMRVLTFDGRELACQETNVSLKSNASVRLGRIDALSVSEFEPASCYVAAKFRGEGDLLRRARLFFAEPKHLRLPPASMTARLEHLSEDAYVIRLRSSVLVRAIQISVEGSDILFSDNGFDLDPAVASVVTFNSDESAQSLVKRVRVRSLLRGVGNTPFDCTVISS
jgi:beta-mannosidase